MREVVEGSNVLYVTRVQKEQFKYLMSMKQSRGRCCRCCTKSDAPSDIIVMHPLPRVYEIHTDVDADPRACYFREMENGMYDEWQYCPLSYLEDRECMVCEREDKSGK